MVLDVTKNKDRRAKDENIHVARGFRGRTIDLVIADGTATINENFEANGKLVALLVEIPDLALTNTLEIEIFPEDATNDEARIFSAAGYTKSLVHYINVQDENTLPTVKTQVYLFGFHNIKVTSSGVVTGDQTVKVVPILAKH